MFTTVKEHDRKAPRRPFPAETTIRGGLSMVAVSAFILVSVGSAIGQPGDQAKKFRASILNLSDSAEQVTVPLFGSVTVETTVEVTRADVVAGHIVEVQVISPRRLLITGQQYGTTSVVLQGADNVQYVLTATVELDVDRLNGAIRAVDPQSDATVHSVLGNLVLTGRVSSAERAKRITELAELFLPPSADKSRQAGKVQNHLEVAGEQQVLLRCVVAEVNRSASRELGINGFLAGENFRDAFLVQQLGGINPINMGAAAGALVTENMPFVTDEAGIPITQATTLSLGFPRAQMQLFIRAMAENSLLSILAEPNLVAISGETATFLAGGEFPIPVPQGNQQVTIEFREFGIRLNFTPQVVGQQRVRLRVAPEVSELDYSVAVQLEGYVVPGLTARATETTVELANGETIAIAGLLSERIRGLTSRVPGIGDIPVLGALFRSVDFQRSLTELVVFVTPEIVAALDAHQKVALPTDGVKYPSDFELYALGLLELEDKEGSGRTRGGASDSAQMRESKPDELSVHGPWGHAQPTDVR